MTTTSTARPASLVFIVVTLILDMLGIGLILPILPRLLEILSGGDIVTAAHVLGLLTALYSGMQFLFGPLTGALSDRFGRRPVLLISLFGLGITYLLSAVAPDLVASWLRAEPPGDTNCSSRCRALRAVAFA